MLELVFSTDVFPLNCLPFEIAKKLLYQNSLIFSTSIFYQQIKTQFKKIMFISICFTFLLLTPFLVKSEIFTNPIQLFELFKAEEEIAKLLQDSFLSVAFDCLKR